ncbi:DUF1385 domain-containing protein [Synergistes jonesii]|uniref:Membrane protein n=1 Tax=Synergistes jonesii TaxID=2754 RepID=A0A073ILT4_9BACT|nr:DUF1385 domain-containing protein [Synergistes jonesii]KEJ91293.1 membrane protein [Synergistes jonesii]
MIAAFALLNMMLFADGEAKRRIPVGGQAVIEGVLMRGSENWGLAVRDPKGKVVLQSWPASKWLKAAPWKYPVVRGFATMVEMMRVGMKALSISADISLGEEEKISPLEGALSIGAALLGVVVLFIALPMLLSEYLAAHFALSRFAANMIEGVARGAVFVAYVALISLWKDIARVFEYHGAEHKTINAFEHGERLEPERVAEYSRIHRRCGTSFLIVVIVVGILVFASIGKGGVLWRVGSRVALLPLVIGLSYEFIRGAAESESWGRYLIMPALLLQYITTRTPSRDQLEVAIAALGEALRPIEKDTASGGAKDGTDRQAEGN